MEKKVVKSLEEQIVIQKKKLEVLEQKAIKQKRDTILNFFKALIDNTELFRLLFINKDNKELQGDIVEYIKGKLNERKEKC
ncbi:hypothetical protein [Fusobacterium nucleatum]|uniref:hypothetical protein n=1 Tax=Fusobacterium nucleatum TaxID=851 RepID=UPI00355C184E